MVDWINFAARKVPVWAIWVLSLLPAPILLYTGATGGLGREPISALEHELGQIALQLLIVGLCITPLRRFFGLNLLRFRRAFGLLAFTYLVFHMLVWAMLDVRSVSQMWTDILKRPYITVGMVGFLLLLPLAVTSTNKMVQRLGGTWWRKLHMLVYPATFLGAVHFVMVQKVWESEPLIYAMIIAGLVALRLPRFWAPSSKVRPRAG